MVRASRKAKADSESWTEPFWSYVGGQEQAKPKRAWGIRRAAKEPPNESSSSVLDYFSDDRNAASSTRKGSQGKRSLFGRKKEEDQGFSFFDAETVSYEDSAWSFLDQPYEISAKEWKGKQKKEHRKEEKIERQEKKEAKKTAVKENKIKLKERKNRGADDESWLGVISSIGTGDSKQSGRIVSPRSKQTNGSRSVVSSTVYVDHPYEVTPREWRRIQRQELRDAKLRQRREKKAQKAAARETRSKARRRRKKKGDDDSWLGVLPSWDDGSKRRGIRPFRTKSKQSSDALSIISSGSWLYGQEKSKKRGFGAGSSGSWLHNPGKSKKTSANENVTDKVLDGLKATFDPWLDEDEDDFDDDDYYSSGSSDVSTDTGDSASTDYESQSEATDSAAADEEPYIDDDGFELQGCYRPMGSLSNARSTVKPEEDDVIYDRDPVPSHRGGCGYFSEALEQRDDYYRYRASDHPVVQSRAYNSAPREYKIPDVLPNSFTMGSDDDQIPEKWRTTITQVGEETMEPEEDYNYAEQDSNLVPFSLALNSAPRAVCCSIKNLSPEQLQLARETGIPIHELSQEELQTIFPKLRSVSTDRALPSRSLVIGNSLSFEKEVPAHVQAVLKKKGPQSLYEYEYESATQQLLLYETFGPNPRELLKLHTADGPPQKLQDNLLGHERVVVQVEASTVSPTDCAIRRGDLAWKSYIPLPNSPGVDVVGVLYRVDASVEKKYNLHKGERVMSLTKWGGNSRFLAVKPEELVKVPDDVDPAEAVCLAETYLSVFQVLHHGQSTSLRYRKNALKGKSFLVVGNMQSNFGRAIGQLASIGGAENVYATAKPKHVQKLCSFGILPVNSDPLDWCARLRSKIDVIISLDEPLTPLHYKVLKDSGEVIVMAQAKEEIFIQSDEGESKAALLNCARGKRMTDLQDYFYDVFSEWDRSLKRSKTDLQYLVGLLQERKILPYILDRIPLTKVPKAHEMIEMKRLPGFIICEPWLVSKSRAVAL